MLGFQWLPPVKELLQDSSTLFKAINNAEGQYLNSCIELPTVSL